MTNIMRDRSEEHSKVAIPTCDAPRGSKLSVTIETTETAKVVSKVLNPPIVKRPRPPVFGHRRKKVIMGRDFLLVSRHCLQESSPGKKFLFSHMPSLSAVEVKVKESSSDSMFVGVPETHMPPQVCLHVQDVDVPMASVLGSPCPPNEEDDRLSPSSCVSELP